MRPRALIVPSISLDGTLETLTVIIFPIRGHANGYGIIAQSRTELGRSGLFGSSPFGWDTHGKKRNGHVERFNCPTEG
jgi:hypothetical protein